MNRDDYLRVKAIVSEVMALPLVEQAAGLSARCGDDAALTTAATRLLASVLASAGRFSAPILTISGVPVTADALGDFGAATAVAAGTSIDSQADAPAETFFGTARYGVRRRLGAGGMGVVYQVDDHVRKRVVALKTMHGMGETDRRQLKREFRALGDLAHPNLVTLYDLTLDDGPCFFTMEYVEGVTFVDDLREHEGGVTRRQRLRHTLPQLISAVNYLHTHGLVHRDLKPTNVLVTPAGRVVVLDFGLATSTGGSSAGPAAGTPAYLAPELRTGHRATAASDWYSVGATLREALAAGATPGEAAADAALHDIERVCRGLLSAEPGDRLTGADALARLGWADAAVGSDGAGRTAVFVGREHELAQLDRALDRVRGGEAVTAIVCGSSGMGKSALVERFIGRRRGDDELIVLRARCREHEAIPYNGLDGIVDGLADHLGTLPSDVRDRLTPADAAALATLFPQLGPVIGRTRRRQERDPVAERRSALAALSDLLDRLSRDHIVVLDIDDFQWADADSVRALTDVLSRPGATRTLAIVSFRSEEMSARPFLRGLVERVDIGPRVVVDLAPFSGWEVDELVRAVVPADRRPEDTIDLVRASDGSPFLADALARHIADGASPAAATLREMLDRRLASVPGPSRAVLEAVSVCSRPVPLDRIGRVAGLEGDVWPLVAQLRAAHLVRYAGTFDRIEIYHDRIREALLSGIPPAAQLRWHEALAEALAESGEHDPEALLEHHRAAGQTVLAAADAAAAAVSAERVLAFELAAAFYRQALDLYPTSADRGRWLAGVGRAMENTGRPRDAAAAYLDAAESSAGFRQIEWRRKAAELFLIGGQIDRGLSVGEAVLRAVGLRLARGPRSAVVSLILRRLQLRWRGLAFVPRVDQTPEDMLAVDAAWSISSGLAMVDPIRAADFNVRQLLRALDLGDGNRVARALALEGGFSVVGPATGVDRARVFFAEAARLAQGDGHAYVAALTTLWTGIAAFLTGRWRDAATLCRQAVTRLSDECHGVTWELNMAHNFFLGGLAAQGELREVAHHLPALVATARERGNLYLELELSTRMILVWLAGDQPDEAERRADDAISRWSQQGFQRQHYNHLLTRVQTALYRGQAERAWTLMVDRRRLIGQSRFLRVEHTRIEATNYRIRTALARAATGVEVGVMHGLVARDVARLRRERRPWAHALAALGEATVASQQGRTDLAADGLARAVTAFEAADMRLYAASARRRRGQTIGGDRGRAEIAHAEAWMASQGIRNPTAMIRVIAPGFGD